MGRERTFATLLTLIAVAVRIYYSTQYYFNPDESMIFNAGSSAQWTLYHHPPLLFYWVWLATLVSDQEWWLRLVPSLAGGFVPLAFALWARRFLSPLSAWGLAALVAVAPDLVLLTLQLRGYSLLMLSVLLAIYALDRAFDERSPRLLLWYFAALYLAILSEFGAAWFVLAAALYSLVRFYRDPGSRGLIALWLGGHGVAAVIYAALYFYVVLPHSLAPNRTSLVTTYLRGAFPRSEENALRFFLSGSIKQLSYVAGSLYSAAVAIGLAAAGLAVWLRRGEIRFLLICSLYLAAAGAFAGFFPFGRSRHTVLIGLLSLAATGAGLDLVLGWRKSAGFLCLASLLAMPFLLPFRDVHNISPEDWRKDRMDNAWRQFEAQFPPGATLLADGESVAMMRSRLSPRGDRARSGRPQGPIDFHGRRVVEVRFDWSSSKDEEVRAAAGSGSGPIWMLDMGFSVDSLRARCGSLGLTPRIDEAGVLFAASRDNPY